LRGGDIGKAALERLSAEYGTDDPKQLLGLTADVRSASETIAYWKQDFGTSEKEHIIFIHINGKEIGVQVKDADLWRAIRGSRNIGEATVHSMMYAAVADGFRNKVTKPLQTLLVGMNPTAVVRLMFQDYPGFLLQSKN